MDTATVAARLVELCSQSKNFDAMQELYADDIVSVEASPRPSGSLETKGKEEVIGKSKGWAAAHEIHGGAVQGPFLLQDRFAVTFQFDVTPKATGKRGVNEEIAVYTVAGGKITREEFFYGVNSEALAR